MHETAEDPLSEFRKVNLSGTESLALAAVRCGVKRFIYLSTIKVNGEATYAQPLFADDRPGYSDSYGQSKWEAEECLIRIAAKTDMEWVIVRPPLVYGPEVRGNFLALMKCVFRRIPLPVGSLHNSRSLVGVFNLSDFLCRLLDHPGAANNRFLVSDRNDVSTPELVRRMAAALHSSAQIVRCPEAVLHLAGTLLRQNAAVQRLCSSLVLDREKTSKYLGWSAPMTLEWGLDRTAEWFLSSRQRH
jgi:nucleoside-diphosphate-sugar epimerase